MGSRWRTSFASVSLERSWLDLGLDQGFANGIEDFPVSFKGASLFVLITSSAGEASHSAIPITMSRTFSCITRRIDKNCAQ
jgi:hypothetical protein